MIKNLSNQTIALAGLSQTVLSVCNLAKTGTTNAEDLETCISSLLKINADDVPEVYGGVDKLHSGFKLLEKQMGPSDSVDTELARYGAALVYLESRFRRQDGMQKAIRVGLERATAQAAHFGITHENVMSSIADLYQNNISKINPRIMVMGEPEYLENPLIANKIRVLLLAGIRSAWLWHQCGGSKLSFLLNRRKIRAEAQRFLQSLIY